MPLVETAQPAMWIAFAVLAAGLALYLVERIPIELTSLGIIGALMIWFHVFPLLDAAGRNRLDAEHFLRGFANPALVAVLALLVMGQGVARTGVLEVAAVGLGRMGGGRPGPSILIAMLAVTLASGVINNTPVVVIFIPIMQALATRFRFSPSRVMMPMSFAAVLGGKLTLIGSSANLLVDDGLKAMGEPGLGFFSFTVPGAVLAGLGLAFMLLVVRRLLPDRAPVDDGSGGDGRQFVAELRIGERSPLVGRMAFGGMFPGLKEMTVKLVERPHESVPPPFEGVRLSAGDVIVVAATRHVLTEALARDTALTPSAGAGAPGAERTLVEAMVPPASRLIGQSVAVAAGGYLSRCRVLGLRRQSRIGFLPPSELRLTAGDVLLIEGQLDDIRALRANRDLVTLAGTRTGIPAVHHARRALLIFAAVVATAAAGVLPIAVAAVAGVIAMLGTGVLNLRQALRALDSGVALTIPAALALGLALQETGGAGFVAHGIVEALRHLGAGPAVVLSAFFGLMVLACNLISSKTMAVLFTPIAVQTARELGIDPQVFAVAVVFAANCAFAIPTGYQTNLLVMGPGHYTFADFLKGGLPMVLFVWLAFSLLAPWYWGM